MKLYKLLTQEELTEFISNFRELLNTESEQYINLLTHGGLWDLRALSHNTWVSPVIQTIGYLSRLNIYSNSEFLQECTNLQAEYEELLFKKFKEDGQVIIGENFSIVQIVLDESNIINGLPPMVFIEYSNKPSGHIVIENSSSFSNELIQLVPRNCTKLVNLKTFSSENLLRIIMKLGNEHIQNDKLISQTLELWFQTTFLNKEQIKGFSNLLTYFDKIHVLTENDIGFDEFVKDNSNINIKRLK